MDLISVIVPVYKVEKYLDKCVQSIVDQTYRNLEIILVDDGSPDNCPAMCDAWAEKDDRIRVIHKENGGLSDARNAGMAIATGEYIGFVDSDDWIFDDFVQHLYQAIRQTGAGIAACDIRTVSENDTVNPVGPETPAYRICTAEAAITDILWNRSFRATACNKLYHCRYLKGEQYPAGRQHEDEFFTYRILAKAEKLVYVDLPLYCYLQRGGSIMHTLTVKRLDVLDALLERISFFQKRFPSLVLRGKVTFCDACVNLYCQGLYMETSERKAFLAKLRSARKQVRFSLKELRTLPVKNCLYVMGSELALDVMCRALNVRRGKECYG